MYFLSYPFAVKAFSSSYVWLLFAVLPPVAPFPLYVTVYVIAVHFAYNVVFDANCVLLFTPLLKFVSLNHPANIYPVFDGDGKPIVPPFQLAVNVWLLAVVTFVSAATFALPLYHPPKFHVAV